jgi:hypothetical protein
MLSLIDLAVDNDDQNRRKSYWNTYYCQNKILTSDGRLYAKYCKNRFCTLCCSIRKADIVNRYLPVIKTWKEPYFVTLTVKAVPLKSLNKVMSAMIRGIKRIIQKYRKRFHRRRGKKLIGIRSLECNFNPTKKTYNPHFHIIVPDNETADILIREWLKLWTRKWTSPSAQNKVRVFNNQAALLETVKYGSKIFTEPDVNRKVKDKGASKIYIAALSNIFNAMKGLRIFDRFGFNLPSKQHSQPTTQVANEFKHWEYDSERYDWISTSGERLSDFNPLNALIAILDRCIDSRAE